MGVICGIKAVLCSIITVLTDWTDGPLHIDVAVCFLIRVDAIWHISFGTLLRALAEGMPEVTVPSTGNAFQAQVARRARKMDSSGKSLP